jgi:DNA-binding response OmpR family regulator
MNFAEDGIQGIQFLRDFAPNLVLVDLVSPSASGMDVLEEALA